MHVKKTLKVLGKTAPLHFPPTGSLWRGTLRLQTKGYVSGLQDAAASCKPDT